GSGIDQREPVPIGLAAERPRHRLQQTDIESLGADELPQPLGVDAAAGQQLGEGPWRAVARTFDDRGVLDVRMLVGAVLHLPQERTPRGRSLPLLDATENLEVTLLVADRQIAAV